MRWLVAPLALLLLSGCLVTRGRYEQATARADRLQDVLDQRRGELADQTRTLEQLRELFQLERTSTESERVELLEEIEDSRARTERLVAELSEERSVREARDAEISDVKGSYESLVESLEGEVEAGRVEIHELRGRLQVRALEQILFDAGSAALRPGGERVLTKVAGEVGKLAGHTIVVEGHTDSAPIATALYPSNWELSCARASAVARFLVSAGVDARLVSASGRAEFEPVADNGSAEGRSQNRRIEIILVPESGE